MVTDIFSDIADFRRYADGLEADTSFGQLKTSIRTASRDIANIIGPEVFKSIAGIPEDANMEEALNLLKSAIATGALYRYQIFASTKKNGTDGSLYKYQHEEIKEHHIEAYWLAMDELLEWLNANPDTGGWKDTGAYADRQALPIRNAREFNEYYGIDNSSYFFSKVLFLLRSVWKKNLKPMLPEGWEKDESLADDVRRTLCYWTIAEAVVKFDVTELPRSIRYDFNHEYTKGTQMQAREKLYADLMGDVRAWSEVISNNIKTAAGATSIQEDHNEERNKFYML